MLELGTKAETLQRIYGKLSRAQVLPQLSFTVKEWNEKRQETLWEKIIEEFSVNPLIVRSSALNEDTASESQAGKFESVGDVTGYENFVQAVNRVIESFDDNNMDNQILVQPMLKNVVYCGVAFTAEPSTLGNYYVINYDETGSTSAITAGSGRESKLLYRFKKTAAGGEKGFPGNLYFTLEELENLFGQDNLDVEFAVTEDDMLYIFQVRALCLNGMPVDYERQRKELARIERKIKMEQFPRPFLCGRKTAYGVMPDWNPAEMIGIRPKPLAMSLYREIITDNIWAYQRDNYGYRNLRSFPLMVDFCGLPYIDVRVSFNSFIPAELDEMISEKLVNYYLERLEKEPSKHDKVEFDIVFSCYTLDLPERIRILAEYGFTSEETEAVITSLRNITNRIINHETGLWRKDYEKIRVLEKRYEEVMSSDLGDLEKIYWLLEDCKRYGTLPFAGLARAAFIAVQLLQSLVNKKIISEKDYELFMAGVETVSSNMNRDFKELSRHSFLKKYGHLRPGTYDITSPRYDEAPELYFDWNKEDSEEKVSSGEVFRLSLKQMQGLTDALTENGLNNNILELMDFIKRVIEGREYGKFVFTRNLSKAIQILGKIGEKYGISREECAYMNIQAVRELYMSTKDTEMNLKRAAKKGREEYELTKSVTLPPLILNAEDVWSFYYPDTEPNYITLGCVAGETLVLEGSVDSKEIKDKILLIQSADPGYDWIFAHGIRGFITKYGGANSHMAIRAGELGIPAVVGVGTKRFEQYRKAEILEINALAKNVRILRNR
ncbi:hypothetical protein C805_03259 [Eubacterium sp. 14-2]|uniref:PEP-utilizing enzyme n=1 Tax=Eubacterium sp. 14-2 TaxID=1235790 RepID=UPI00033ABE9F|nr:PEP-utilizing enzyme [Eubacterium sp. 14-2]EOT23594.1 hypothetical protein C805_03259 [Eubacterium sp. 14-2]